MPACTLCLRNCELHCERESACTMGDAQGLAAWQAPYIVKVLDPGCTLIIVHPSAVCIRMHRQSRELAADEVGDQSCTHPPSPLIRHLSSSPHNFFICSSIVHACIASAIVTHRCFAQSAQLPRWQETCHHVSPVCPGALTRYLPGEAATDALPFFAAFPSFPHICLQRLQFLPHRTYDGQSSCFGYLEAKTNIGRRMVCYGRVWFGLV